jgi:type VI secretion system secreted protein Hcp
MPFDAFLKIGDITGESNDPKHKDEIEVLSFSWGEALTGTLGGGAGGGSPKVSMQDFSAVILNSIASPELFLRCAKAQTIPTATLSVRRRTGAQIEYLKWEFNDVVISSFGHAGESEAGDKPTEEISLFFGKVFFEYQRLDASGGPVGQPLRRGWDRINNQQA